MWRPALHIIWACPATSQWEYKKSAFFFLTHTWEFHIFNLINNRPINLRAGLELRSMKNWKYSLVCVWGSYVEVSKFDSLFRMYYVAFRLRSRRKDRTSVDLFGRSPANKAPVITQRAVSTRLKQKYLRQGRKSTPATHRGSQNGAVFTFRVLTSALAADCCCCCVGLDDPRRWLRHDCSM